MQRASGGVLRLWLPRSLRAMFGTDGTRNAVHGSDCAAAAARELRFFFPALAPALAADADTGAQPLPCLALSSLPPKGYRLCACHA